MFLQFSFTHLNCNKTATNCENLLSFKNTNVSPIYKKYLRLENKKHCLIGILPNLLKFCERIMYSQIIS